MVRFLNSNELNGLVRNALGLLYIQMSVYDAVVNRNIIHFIYATMLPRAPRGRRRRI